MANGSSVRVRIAPSPTGMPHVGLFHTFLFNWLYARHENGTFIVRIEDTDTARRVEGAVEALLDAIRWLGLSWDEGPGMDGPYGPYVQSERLPLYQEHAERLVREGKAYYCYCTPERLEELRADQERRKVPPGYDRRCRNLSEQERTELAARSETRVIRFAVPLEGETVFDDVLRGPIVWENRLLDDFVILKSDGYPTYHLAHLVDDHYMDITDVLRGEEWISSTPRHILLYQAFGWTPPRFCHLPPLLGPDRKKLSKRHGAMSVLEYRDAGYLPEAMVNYLAIIGASYEPTGTREIFSLPELVEGFDLAGINKAGAIFDLTKLEWMNGYYIRHLPVPELANRLMPFFERAGLLGERAEQGAALVTALQQPATPAAGRWSGDQLRYVERLVPLVQERLKRLDEAPDLLEFAFADGLDYPSKLLIAKGLTAESSRKAMAAALEFLRTTPDFADEPLEAALRRIADEVGVKFGQLAMILRVAVTGRQVSPPLTASMVAIGRERTVQRVAEALRRLDELAPGGHA
ncbi:MAG TPA: glutamate--tRNA ligase [Chloroflexota bacterium]|nr:glutamate--tRNA ligase [Chloroflexota bacterium]